MSADYDSPWKEALDFYFESFLALLFPTIHEQIDSSPDINSRAVSALKANPWPVAAPMDFRFSFAAFLRATGRPTAWG